MGYSKANTKAKSITIYINILNYKEGFIDE